MKRLFLFFSLIFSFLFSEIDWDEKEMMYTYSQLKPAPLAPLAEEFPLSVSEENRLVFMDGKASLEKEKEKIERGLQKHTFPWIKFLSVILLAFFLYFFYLFLLKSWSVTESNR